MISIEDDTVNFLKMWRQAKPELSDIRDRQTIVSGMGGSGIGGEILSALSDITNFCQVTSWNNYGLPQWVTEDCYVICISYSGNTAETLSAAKAAIEIGCKFEVITTGG